MPNCIPAKLPLDSQVESIFDGEFLFDENPIFHGSDVERCISPDMYPPIPSEDPYSSCDYPSDDDDIFGFDCLCGGFDIGGAAREVCICHHARDPYD